MMNTKVYKAVLNLAGQLMDAAHVENQAKFDSLYADLKALCMEHENTEKDHPVQWEALADFTEDLADAVVVYAKALEKAEAINSKDYISSVAFSMATLQVELGQVDDAIINLQNAKISANKIADKDLKAEINTLLEKLSPSATDAKEVNEVPTKLALEKEPTNESDLEPKSTWPYS